MAEISASELNEREQKALSNAKLAIERGNFEYAVEICRALLESQLGCLEVRRVLRSAQQEVHARSFTIVDRIVGRVMVTLKAALGYSVLKKNPSKAMIIGELILSSNPYNVRGLSLVARGAEKLELYETEAFCLESICDRFPDNVDKLERLCEALINVGHTDEALRISERLSSLRPGNTKVQELVKSASVAHSIKRGKWAEGEKDFRSKLKDQGEAESLERANRVVFDDANKESRIRDLKSNIDRDPNNLDQYKLVVRAHLAKEEFALALEWLEKAFELPQASSDASLMQLRSELRVRHLDQLIYDLKVEDKRVGQGTNQARIDELTTELNQLKLQESRKLVEQFPNDYTQRFRYGEQLLKSGDVENAIQQFQVSQRSPSLKLKSLVCLGKCFMAKNLYDLAFEQLSIANESLKSMDDFKKEVVYSIAECCEQLGKREDAITYFKTIYANDISFRDVAEKIDSYYR